VGPTAASIGSVVATWSGETSAADPPTRPAVESSAGDLDPPARRPSATRPAVAHSVSRMAAHSTGDLAAWWWMRRRRGARGL